MGMVKQRKLLKRRLNLARNLHMTPSRMTYRSANILLAQPSGGCTDTVNLQFRIIDKCLASWASASNRLGMTQYKARRSPIRRAFSLVFHECRANGRTWATENQWFGATLRET